MPMCMLGSLLPRAKANVQAWSKTGLCPFNRSVYWDIKLKEDQRKEIAAQVEIDPDKLTVQGMVRVLFPRAAAASDAAHARQQEEQERGEQGSGEQVPTGVKQGKRKRGEPANSSDLWFYHGGATGDEVYNLVKAKTEARLAKEAQTKANKEKRAQDKKDKVQAANGLGASMFAKLTCLAEVEKLKVPELTGCLTYRGVPIPQKAKKADLVALLIKEVGQPGNPPPASSGVDVEVDASASRLGIG